MLKNSLLRSFPGLLVLIFSALAMAALAADKPPAAVSKASADQQMPRVVMVQVGNQEITVRDFMQYIIRTSKVVEKATTPEGKHELLTEMVSTELLTQEVRRRGWLPGDPSLIDLRKAIAKLAQAEFPAPGMPGDEEIQAYYEGHPERFGIPPLVRISHIQFQVPYNGTAKQKHEAWERAEAVLARVRKGEDFGSLAVELSDAESAKENKGDVGFMSTKIPWLEKALQGVQVGEYTGIVESPAGFEILLLMDMREGYVRPLAEVRDEAIGFMLEDGQRKARDAYVKELAAKTKIVTVMEGIGDVSP